MNTLTLTPVGLWHSVRVTAALQGGKDTLGSNPTPTNNSQESATQKFSKFIRVSFSILSPLNNLGRMEADKTRGIHQYLSSGAR